MSEFKGTKGEWAAEPQKGSKNHCFQAQVFCENHSIAVVDSTENPNESTANAKVIACAPEMLKELQLIFKNYDKGTDTYTRLEQLIKKATL